MYFHGGGWILGGRDTHDRLVREIAVGVEAAVVFVDYARSPEARYPVAIEQAYAATCYAVDHGVSLRIDPLRLAVAGDSVGGNMAAAVTLMAKATARPEDCLSGAVLSGHGCRFRHGFLFSLRGWAVVD